MYLACDKTLLAVGTRNAETITYSQCKTPSPQWTKIPLPLRSPRLTLGSPHWLPCHEVEGKRSAFFNFPSVDISLSQINSLENVKYARDSFGHWPPTGNELRNYRCELFVAGGDLFKRRQVMHIRKIKQLI